MNQASSGRWLEIMKDLVSPVGKKQKNLAVCVRTIFFQKWLFKMLHSKFFPVFKCYWDSVCRFKLLGSRTALIRQPNEPQSLCGMCVR